MNINNFLNSARIRNFNNELAKSGLSLTLFCKKLNLQASNMSSILNGKHPFTEALAEKIENALDCKPRSITHPNNNAKIRRYTGEKVPLFDSMLYEVIDKKSLNIDNLSLILPSDDIIFDFNYENNLLHLMIDHLDKSLLSNERYLIKYKGYVFIRKFYNNYFITNDKEFYVDIVNSDLIDVLGRVIALATIEEH
jgi:transcriptional regulator with XRE-family HTH domain